MRRLPRFLAATSIVLVMWFLAIAWVGSRIESDLTSKARALFSTEGDERFNGVGVAAQGQELRLTGVVKSDADKAAAEALARESVRAGARPLPWPAEKFATGEGLNPINGVLNEIRVDAGKLKGQGWVLLSIHRDRFQLSGEVADYRAKQAVIDKFGQDFAKLTPADNIVIKENVEALAPKDLPAPSEDERKNGWAAISASGKPWIIVSGADSPEILKTKQAEVEAAGLKWSTVAAELSAMKRPQGIPSRIALGVADKEVYYHGTVADDASKAAIEAALQAKYPPPMTLEGTVIVDSKLASPGLPNGIALLSAALPEPPLTGGPELLVATLSGDVLGGKRPREELASAVQASQRLCPAGLTPSVIAAHLAEILPKLREAITSMPEEFPANIILASSATTPQKVVIAGDVPDQAAKDAILAAIGKKYPGIEMGDRLRVTAGAILAKDAKNANTTIDTIPGPSKTPNQPYTVGLAELGGPWNSRPFGTLKEAKDPDQYAGFIAPDAKAELKTKLSQEFGLALADIPEPPPPPPPPPIAAEDPVLNIFAENKILRVGGEILDEETKTKITDTLKAKWTGWEINLEGLVVTPNVKPCTDLAAALATLPGPPKEGARFVSMSRLGESPRADLVHSIKFATGQSDWSRDRDRALAQVRRIIQFSPTATFEVSGHTDSEGDAAANQKLSEDRATALKEFFMQNGIPAVAITTRGAGSKEPLGDNATEPGRALNRRVDITLK